jgi:hypothetical protein
MAMKHPCQFSPEVLEVIEPLLRPGEHVHDPFAGPGNRLAALCDKIGCTFSGGDIEDWPGKDERVAVSNAMAGSSYPSKVFTLVTSPVYQNKRCADYRNGPGPNTKVKGRRDYGIALGRPLDPCNLARYTGRPKEAESYWELHAEAVKHWPDRVIVNVDLPIADRWLELLLDAGYPLREVIPAYTRRYRGLDNAEKRAEYEVVVVAER